MALNSGHGRSHTIRGACLAASRTIVLAGYLLRSLRTTATAPIPVARSVSVMGSGTAAGEGAPANAGIDKANVTAESIVANLSILFTVYLLFDSWRRGVATAVLISRTAGGCQFWVALAPGGAFQAISGHVALARRAAPRHIPEYRTRRLFVA